MFHCWGCLSFVKGGSEVSMMKDNFLCFPWLLCQYSACFSNAAGVALGGFVLFALKEESGQFQASLLLWVYWGESLRPGESWLSQLVSWLMDGVESVHRCQWASNLHMQNLCGQTGAWVCHFHEYLDDRSDLDRLLPPKCSWVLWCKGWLTSEKPQLPAPCW